MSQEINLYETRLRPRRELATARNLGVSLLLAIAMTGVTANWTNRSAAKQVETEAALQKEVKDLQERLTAAVKNGSERHVSPGLAAEVERTRSLLADRMEAMHLLEADNRENVPGFASVMAGFARLTRPDLWLISFRLGRGGEEIEIRGRTLDASAVPDYVLDLGAQDVFRGRRFAALDLREWSPQASEGGQGASVPGQAMAMQMPSLIEFVLRSELRAEPHGLSGNIEMERRRP